jgi:phage/plasmid-associated DNA primase
MPSTSLIPYLELNNILWFPIYIEVIDGKKQLQPYRETGKRPKTTDFQDLTAQEIQARQQWISYKHIAIDTTNIGQVDIDNKDMDCTDAINNKPHFLSTTKKLPHFFVKFDLPEGDTRNKIVLADTPGVDYLCGLWSWAPRDVEVVNATKDIQTYIVPDERVEKEYRGYNTDYSGVEIKEILEAIPADCPYDTWVKIGASLYNSGFKFEDWDTWSRKSENYNPRGMEAKWDSFMTLKNVGFGTLMYHLQHSAPAKFREVAPKLMNKDECIFIKDIEGNEYRTLTNKSVAELFFNLFQDKYVFDTEWYMFDSKSGIMKMLDKKMVEAYMLGDSMTYITNLLNKIIKITKDKDSVDKLIKIKNKTESSAFMKASFAFKETRFADSEFRDKLDTFQHTFGFKNGVYDMNELGGVFRMGEKTDCISKYVDFNWDSICDHDFFDNLIYSMFEDQEMADWFKKHLGSLFVGGNIEEKFYFWDGSGRNGKGCVDTLLKSIMGKFYTGLDVAYFTTYKKESNAPEPHLLKMKDTKCVMINELGENTKLITNKIKQISGNDAIPARALYSNKVIDIDCSFKCIIQTNHLPEFTDIDDGLLDRICPIHFPFRFVSEDVFDPEDPQHRRANIDLKGVCKEKKVEFFNYVMNICVPAYRNHGIYPLPQMVENNIDKYRSKIDDVGLFARTELKESQGAIISGQSAFGQYMAWRSQVCETDVPTSRDKFAKRLKSILGESAYKRAMVDGSRQRCIYGYAFVNEYNYNNNDW